MTTTPIGSLFAGLVPGAVVGPVPAPVTGTPGDVFLALVQELLDRTPDETTDGTPDNAADQPTGQPPGQPVTVTAPRQIEDAPVLMPEVADADTAVIAVPPPAVTAAVAAVVAPLAPAPSATTSTTPAVEQPAITAATTETATPAPPPTPTPSPAPKVERPDVTVPETATPTAPSPAPATPAPAPAPTVPATALPVAPAPPGDTHRVTQQVFPEVVRVTTSPDGPQRVTVKLNPESLGEVRVVLTSRHGSLEVSITAGTEARTALVEGAPELQRLLESVGRGDSRIVVRDPAGVPTDPGTGTGTGPGTGPGTGTGTGGTGTGTGRPGGDARPDHHPRQHGPGSNTATDGAPATTTPSRRTESVTRARTGLDVTM